MLKIKNLKRKIVILVALLFYVLVLQLFHISCPVLVLTGVPCPCCGMTRALIAALHLQFETAFSFHPMFWTIPFLFLCFLFDGKLFPEKWLNFLLYGLFALGFIAQWVLKVFF